MAESERSMGSDELREIRRLRLSDVGFGRLPAFYMAWHLRGIAGRPFYPEAVLGIFPVSNGDGVKYELESLIPPEACVEDYYADASGLIIPKAVDVLERALFEGSVDSSEGLSVSRIAFQMVNNLPSGVLMFERAPGEMERSVYLIVPKLTPPSRVLGQFQGTLPNPLAQPLLQ